MCDASLASPFPKSDSCNKNSRSKIDGYNYYGPIMERLASHCSQYKTLIISLFFTFGPILSSTDKHESYPSHQVLPTGFLVEKAPLALIYYMLQMRFVSGVTSKYWPHLMSQSCSLKRYDSNSSRFIFRIQTGLSEKF